MHISRLKSLKVPSSIFSANRIIRIIAIAASLFCSNAALAQTPPSANDTLHTTTQTTVTTQTTAANDTLNSRTHVLVPIPPPAESSPAGEANLVLPDLSSVYFIGMTGHNLLMIGLIFCALGLTFGLLILRRLKNMAVHRSMREISELIYETCKTYLITQGKFLVVLWIFIAVVITLYFGVLSPTPGHPVVQTVCIILLFSVVGVLGSYGVAWFGIRVNTYANSRTAFAGLGGKPYPIYAIPLQAGMSVGMMLISVELLIMLFILLFVPSYYAGPCFIGFAIGESLGAAALRIAGGIFTKIADIGSDLMKIVFK